MGINAIQIHSHGGTEVLQIRSLPTPRPEAGEVLVRVKTAALNPIDASVRQGYFPGAKKPPLILGREAAGVVEQASDGFRAGERVLVASAGGFGVFRDGVWAELIAVPDQWLRRIPDAVNFNQAAALSNTGVTALAALRVADPRPGEALLVLGAAGGVGWAGVQSGKVHGLRVIAVTSSREKLVTLQSSGADEVLALSDGPLVEQLRPLTGGEGVDIVLDPVGGDLTGQALSALKPLGRLVHVGYTGGTSLSLDSFDLLKPARILGFNLFTLPEQELAKDVDAVVRLAGENRLRPLVDRAFPFHQIIRATERLSSRDRVGKVVINF